MIWVYRLLFPLLFVLGLPFYLLRMFRRGGYGPMMKGRFGLVTQIPKTSKRKRIWLQAVSVGELLAIEGLVKRLSEREDLEIILSTTTSTGYELARKKYKDLVLEVISFPLDFYFCIGTAWNRINPDFCIITEAELWPEHIEAAKKRGIPLFLINARLSDKSFRRMASATVFKNLFFQKITHIGASSSFDADRIHQLGYPLDRMTVTGNLKFDVVDPSGLNECSKSELMEEIWGVHSAKEVPFTVIGASTWAGEELLLIEAGLELKKHGISVRIILTPRHAERRSEIRKMLEDFGAQVNWQFRSQKEWEGGSPSPESLPVYVADTTGELKNLLQIADVAVIGRSFPPHTEGQTPIEAAALGVPVVYGPSLSNFRSICRGLEKQGGVLRVKDPEQLPATLRMLVDDPEVGRALSKAAVDVFERSRGSTERTYEMISKHALKPSLDHS